MIYIRRYRSADCEQILKLFFETIHSVNLKDYNKKQIQVWASGEEDPILWNNSLSEHFTIIAADKDRKDIITGFGDIDKTGYLDRLYVHKDYQNQGIATMICDQLEKAVNTASITTFASITAVPFFQSRGYRIIQKQEVIRKGISLTNFRMEKLLTNDI